MTTEQQSKKPPAHEVIVQRIEAICEHLDQWARDGTALFNSPLPTHTAPGQHMVQATRLDYDVIVAQAMVLVEVLVAMHIPKEARPNVVRVLRDLPSACFSPTIESVFAEIEGDAEGA